MDSFIKQPVSDFGGLLKFPPNLKQAAGYQCVSVYKFTVTLYRLFHETILGGAFTKRSPKISVYRSIVIRSHPILDGAFWDILWAVAGHSAVLQFPILGSNIDRSLAV